MLICVREDHCSGDERLTEVLMEKERATYVCWEWYLIVAVAEGLSWCSLEVELLLSLMLQVLGLCPSDLLGSCFRISRGDLV